MTRNIFFDSEQKTFHLSTEESSYVMGILNEGTISHLYYGKRIRKYRGSKAFIFMDRGFSPNPTLEDSTFSYDTIPQEYRTNADGDFRVPGYQTLENNGSRISRFHYDSHEIIHGKPKLQGLPHTYVTDENDAETLIIYAERCRERSQN